MSAALWQPMMLSRIDRERKKIEAARRIYRGHRSVHQTHSGLEALFTS